LTIARQASKLNLLLLLPTLGSAKENVARMDDLSSAESIETLRSQHQSLESRLAALNSQLSLTTAEQTERVFLKKKKLAIKDRIQLLLQRSAET
jgi:hypothetical protein